MTTNVGLSATMTTTGLALSAIDVGIVTGLILVSVSVAVTTSYLLQHT